MVKAHPIRVPLEPKELSRFWARIDKTSGYGPDGCCWEWQGATWPNGYGKLRVNGLNIGAHRVAYVIQRGPIPNGLCVCHHCDNRLCCRKDHLFTGTIADNHADMCRKGRQVVIRGEDNHAAKLTEAQVAEMRCRYVEDGDLTRVLAQAYGVDPGTVTRIVHGQKWKHAPGPICSPYPREGAHVSIKLTVHDVVAIRDIYADRHVTQEQLAVQFGVSSATIGDILARRTWRRVPGNVVKSPAHAAGSRGSCVKLTAIQIPGIRREYAGGQSSLCAIGRKYGVTDGAIRKIIRRQTWSHVP